jgi:ribosomal protein L30/L7E
MRHVQTRSSITAKPNHNAIVETIDLSDLATISYIEQR